MTNSFKAALDTLSHTIRSLEEEWIELGYGALTILEMGASSVDGKEPLGWRQYGDKGHRIMYAGRPLGDWSLENRLAGFNKIPELKKRVEAKAESVMELIKAATNL